MIQLAMPSFGRRICSGIFCLLTVFFSADAQRGNKKKETGARFHIKVTGIAKIDSLCLQWNDHPCSTEQLTLNDITKSEFKKLSLNGRTDFYIPDVHNEGKYISHLSMTGTERHDSIGPRRLITYEAFPMEPGDDVIVDIRADIVEENTTYGK